MNSVNLVGRIGNDIEVKYTNSGKPVTNVNIAVNEYYNNQETTHWFRVTVWNKQAENLAQYCSKGSQIGVSGRLTTNSFTDKNGLERRNTEIVATHIDFLDQKSTDSNQPNSNYNKQNNTPFSDEPVNVTDADLPF